jgi:hypothetical protein
MAQIAIMRDGKFVHRESKTFDRRPAANAWIKKREAELAKPGGLDLARSDKRSPTLADAIARYVAESKRQLGRTKEQVQATLKSLDIAERPCAEITSADLVELARWLGESRKPQTVGNYLSHLAAIFAIARPAWGYPLNEQAMADGFKVSRRLGYTAKPTERDRRPPLPRRARSPDDAFRGPEHQACRFCADARHLRLRDLLDTPARRDHPHRMGGLRCARPPREGARHDSHQRAARSRNRAPRCGGKLGEFVRPMFKSWFRI